MNCSCEYCKRSATPTDRINDKLVDEAAQRAFLGGVSHMYLRRRAADPRFCFPKAIYMGRRPFRWLSDLAAWVESPHAQLRTERHFEKPEARIAS